MLNKLNHVAFFVKVVGACAVKVLTNKYIDKEINVDYSVRKQCRVTVSDVVGKLRRAHTMLM
jgi:hypothetical protein